MSESPELTKLKSFLNSLFQFENQDLDFGIYKILNYKREAINSFIETLLTDEVKSQLNIIQESEREKLKEQLDELVKDDLIKGFVEAIDDNTKEVLKSVSKEKIENYLALKEQFDSHISTSNAELVIYNHLTEFFKRYYDKGDFISKRRYSKNEKYVVPYNGEETYFYWANQDQYYIKSSEFFTKYSFKVNISPNQICIVNFKLAEAQEESGNVKSESNKFFILSDKSLEQKKEEINIYFEYRSVSEDEKQKFGKNQDEINSKAVEKVLKELEKNSAYTELKKIVTKDSNEKNQKKEKAAKNKLKFELDKYSNRNKYDFFIHKDLKGFLSRELDFYIKNEMLYLNDLSLFDSETHLEKIKLHLNIIKTFKHIADTIIDFVSQIENFQKKLWEKKKFVINTHYVITLDKLSEYTAQEFMKEVIAEVIKNREQINEWKELFGKELFKDRKIKAEDLKADMYSYKKFPIDTKYFSDKFKWKLLSEISKKIDVEGELNGLLLHSDNYQGLNLLQEKYYGKVNCIYIDPPFNLDKNADYLYKVDYKNSTWNTLLYDRIKLSKNLLSHDGGYFVNSDDNGNMFTRLLMDKLFGSGNFINEILWCYEKPGGGENQLKNNHSTIFFYVNGENYEYNITFVPRKGETELTQRTGRFKTDYAGKISSDWWNDIPSFATAMTAKERTAKKLGIPFKTQQPEKLVMRIMNITSKPMDLVCDFFGGSGVSSVVAHKTRRKYLTIELGSHFYDLIIPSLKLVLFGEQYGISKLPEVDWGGSGFFKYQKLEQYEDSLENIAFTKAIDDIQLEMYKDYIPKYFLDFETSESKTFLNIDEMQNPFDYKLRVFDNYDYVEQPIDLIETFNYLIGLYVHKYKMLNDQHRDYYFVYGKDRSGKYILVIWRDVNKIDFKKDKLFIEKELKNYLYDTLYINSQSAADGYNQIETVFKKTMN